MSSAQNIVGASQCFEQWHHATCHNYSVTDYRRTTPAPFHGHIEARSFGALTVSELASFASESRIEVIRGSSEIRRDPRDHFMLLLAYRGEVGFAQAGRTTRLSRGDMVIYDQARPFSMEFGADTREVVVTIPRALLASRLPEVERFTARRITSASKFGALTATVVRQLVDFEDFARRRCRQPAWRFRARHSGNDPQGGVFRRGRGGRQASRAACKGEALCGCQPARRGDDHRQNCEGPEPGSAHPAPAVFSRRHHANSLVVATTPAGELQGVG